MMPVKLLIKFIDKIAWEWLLFQLYHNNDIHCINIYDCLISVHSQSRGLKQTKRILMIRVYRSLF
jgi:hypothetical protein